MQNVDARVADGFGREWSTFTQDSSDLDARVLNRIGIPTRSIPLEAYKDLSFYTMRTDAYDRFCTSLEKRFTRVQIEPMLKETGFDQIAFSNEIPFWCAVARKAR